MESPAKVHVFYIDYGNVSAGARAEGRQGGTVRCSSLLGQAQLSNGLLSLSMGHIY